MASFIKTTEQNSRYDALEAMPLSDLLLHINREDQSVPWAVEKAIGAIEALTTQIIARLKNGGRLFYIGAGTSGRMGILDASECPPTFGVPHELVTGIIAGGDSAIRKAVEHAEDDPEQAWRDLETHGITEKDCVVGIAASGTTPYVIGGIQKARAAGVLTGCICCNAGSPLALATEYPVEVITGPEFITGSSRMKAGTAQKLVLNMISTSTMIALGRVAGNKMVDMQLSNDKLIERGTRMIVEATGLADDKARELLLKTKSVRAAIDHFKNPAL